MTRIFRRELDKGMVLSYDAIPIILTLVQSGAMPLEEAEDRLTDIIHDRVTDAIWEQSEYS
jgi:hypothetical protein